MNGYFQLVKEKLEAAGYRYLRPGKGAHEVWTNDSRNQIVSKNMPSRHMANEIMKQAGIDHKF